MRFPPLMPFLSLIFPEPVGLARLVGVPGLVCTWDDSGVAFESSSARLRGRPTGFFEVDDGWLIFATSMLNLVIGIVGKKWGSQALIVGFFFLCGMFVLVCLQILMKEGDRVLFNSRRL